MRRDRDERRKKSWSGSRAHCRSVLNQPKRPSLAVPCDGTGRFSVDGSILLNLLGDDDVSSDFGHLAVSSLFPRSACSSPSWRTAAGLASGEWWQLLRPLTDGSHPSSTQDHVSELSVPPVVKSLQHHSLEPLAVTAPLCCPTSSLRQRAPSSSRVSVPM